MEELYNGQLWSSNSRLYPQSNHIKIAVLGQDITLINYHFRYNCPYHLFSLSSPTYVLEHPKSFKKRIGHSWSLDTHDVWTLLCDLMRCISVKCLTPPCFPLPILPPWTNLPCPSLFHFTTLPYPFPPPLTTSPFSPPPFYPMLYPCSFCSLY